MIYDVGVNLFNSQFKDPVKIIDDAAKDSIKCVLTGTSRDVNRKIVEFVKDHDCYGTLGIHPHNADRFGSVDEEFIRSHINDPGIVAVGECGLDFDRMYSIRENQIDALKRQIKIAEEYNKPLFLHERSAHREFMDVFREHPNMTRKAVIHCFTSGKEELQEYLDAGFWIGITGWICDDRRGAALQEAAKYLDPDRLMIETDSPYLKPVKKHGINVPNNVVYVLDKLAELMEIDRDVLAEKVKRGTETFFGI